jgi:hypothetical protein
MYLLISGKYALKIGSFTYMAIANFNNKKIPLRRTGAGF